MSKITVPFYSLEDMHLQTGSALRDAFESTLKSNWFVLGEKLSQFEKQFSKYLHCEYVSGVANGLEALQLALLALDIGKGDEVLVPAHTFAASFLSVLHTGATPVPVEVDKQTCNLSISNCKGYLNANTKAIMPVHLYGNACDMESIMNFAKTHNLWVIEDNAQAVGATFNGKKTGIFGHINACSFYPSKTLGALGDAGAISTNDTKLYKRIKQLRNYGSSIKYELEVEGMNSRMDELQAAFLTAKLPYLDEWNKERALLASSYSKALKGVEGLILPTITDGCQSVWHVYAIRTVQRDALQKFLDKNGIKTVCHYPIPPHIQKAFKHLGYKKGDFPITESIAAETLSLPLYPGLTATQQHYVIDCIKAFFQAKGK